MTHQPILLDQPIGDMQCDDVMLGSLGTLSEKVLKKRPCENRGEPCRVGTNGKGAPVYLLTFQTF